MRKIINNLISSIIIALIILNTIFPNFIYAQNDSNTFTLEQAIMEFKKQLEMIRQVLENNYSRVNDYNRKTQIIQEMSAIPYYTSGPYYEVRIAIANKIFPESDKQIFLNNISKYVEEFLQEKYAQDDYNDDSGTETISLLQAIIELKVKLGIIKNDLENQYATLDSKEREMRIREIISNFPNQHSGIFANYKTQIANRIAPESDKQIFLDNIPEYIDDFLTEVYGQKITATDIFNEFTYPIDAVAGMFTYKVKVLFIIVPGAIIELIETMLASIGSEAGIFGINKILALDHILFNKVPLIDINIFDIETAGDSPISNGNVLVNIRENIAKWYYALRNLAIVLALAVLIYTGVRMAISSIADDKAKYKKMLVDWLVSFALIFVLHYLMIFIIQLNDGIIGVLAEAQEKEREKIQNEVNLLLPEFEYGDINIDTGSFIKTSTLQGRLLIEAFSPFFTRGWASAILYIMLVAMTFLFLMSYIKRFLTISFLIIISPLITVTYAIDKAGDGKAQALNKWIKEFVFNILVQPFHCIIYMVFVQNILYVIDGTIDVLQFGKIIIAIMMIGFIYKADDIVKQIFGFEAKNLATAAMVGSTIMKGVNTASSLVSAGTAVKSAGTKAEKVKNIDTGNNKANGGTGNSGTGNGGTGNGGTGNGGTGNGGTQKTGPNRWERFEKWSNKSAKFLAKHALVASLGYGATGDYKGALAAEGVSKKIDNMVLNSRVQRRKDEALDAYENYKQKHGKTAAEMLSLSGKLIKQDISTITDADERQLAQALQAYSQTKDILGSEDPVKDIMKELQEYETT